VWTHHPLFKSKKFTYEGHVPYVPCAEKVYASCSREKGDELAIGRFCSCEILSGYTFLVNAPRAGELTADRVSRGTAYRNAVAALYREYGDGCNLRGWQRIEHVLHRAIASRVGKDAFRVQPVMSVAEVLSKCPPRVVTGDIAPRGITVRVADQEVKVGAGQIETRSTSSPVASVKSILPYVGFFPRLVGACMRGDRTNNTKEFRPFESGRLTAAERFPMIRGGSTKAEPVIRNISVTRATLTDAAAGTMLYNDVTPQAVSMIATVYLGMHLGPLMPMCMPTPGGTDRLTEKLVEAARAIAEGKEYKPLDCVFKRHHSGVRADVAIGIHDLHQLPPCRGTLVIACGFPVDTGVLDMLKGVLRTHRNLYVWDAVYLSPKADHLDVVSKYYLGRTREEGKRCYDLLEVDLIPKTERS